jgi:hypothetical protein
MLVKQNSLLLLLLVAMRAVLMMPTPPGTSRPALLRQLGQLAGWRLAHVRLSLPVGAPLR